MCPLGFLLLERGSFDVMEKAMGILSIIPRYKSIDDTLPRDYYVQRHSLHLNEEYVFKDIPCTSMKNM